MTSPWYQQRFAQLVATPRAGTAFAELVRRAMGGSAAAPSLGVAAVAAAYAAGERNPTRLTDVVFHARHRERRGRAIGPGERRRAQEWKWIRDQVIAPALRQAAVAPASPPASAVAPASRYTLPADPAQLRPAARTQIRAVPLFPGDRALAVEAQLIRDVAARPDGWVYLANWYAGLVLAAPMLDPELLPVADALKQCRKRGGTIRALFWDGSKHQLGPAIDRITSPLVGIGGGALRRSVSNLIRGFVRSQTNYAVNRATADFINGLGAPNAIARLDDATLLLGSHHQKILVVGNRERLVAVVGGVDLNPNRVRPIPKEPGTPYVDISLQLDGEAASDVAEIFERRWRADRSRAEIPLPKRGRPTAAPPAAGATVQVGVNYGCRRPLSDVPRAIRGGSELITNVLRNCQMFFYAEDQYGVGNAELEDAIKRAFANGARYGIVVLASEAAVDDLPEIALRRHQFWTRFKQIRQNLFVFERFGDDSRPRGPHAYVHSKLLLVDDRAASISSLNMNRRSWSYDSEIVAVIADAPALLANLRLGLWRSHLTDAASDDEIRDPAAAFRLWHSVYWGLRRAPRLRPVRFFMPPPRVSARLASHPAMGLAVASGIPLMAANVTYTIDGVMDAAFSRIFDPRGDSSC